MSDKSGIIKETLKFAAFEAIVSGLTFAVCFLIKGFALNALIGVLVGFAVSILNVYLMFSALLMISYEAENPQKAANKNKALSMGRMVLIGVILVVAMLTKFCNVIMLVIPILFTKPVLMLQQFIGKKGENK